MKKKYKSCLALCLLILMPFSIIGCWGRRETQQMNLSTAMGFDRVVIDGHPQFRFTILSTKNPQSSAAGAASSQGISEPAKTRTSSVFSVDGDTIWDAGRNWNLRSSRQLFIGQVIVIVVGEETAREGLGEIIDFLLRHQDARERAWLVVCRGLAADLLNARPEEESIASVEINGILRDGWTRTAKVKGIDLFHFSYDLITPGREAVLPYMELFEPQEPSSPIRQTPPANTESGSQGGNADQRVNQAQKKSFEALGFAVFRGNKMVGLMDEVESQGFLYLTDQVKTAALPIAIDSNEKNVSVRVAGAKTRVKPVFSEGRIEFEVSIKANGDLLEEKDGVVKISEEDWKMVEELGAREIERRCLAASGKIQELESDVLGFGDKIHRTNPEIWKEIKDNWEEIFPNVTINVKAELKVKQTGVLSDPIVVR